MQTLYLFDATFELFRAYYSSPEKINDHGKHIGAAEGSLRNIENSIRRFGITHIGCATDQIIESFRNKMFPGYKTGEGLPADLTEQFPVIEAGLKALGITVWPMRKFEADDALATAAYKYEKHFDEIIIASPDKDFYQCINEKVFVYDIIRQKRYGFTELEEKLGITPQSLPSYLGLVGDNADGIPGLAGFGAKSSATLLKKYTTVENIPVDEERLHEWPKVRGAAKLQATLRAHRGEALLYRDLAILRTDVPLSEGVDDLKIQSFDRRPWEKFCAKTGINSNIAKRS